MKKHFELLILFLGAITVGALLSYYIFAPVPRFKRNVLKIVESELNEDLHSFLLDTYNNAISSQNIIDLIHFCEVKISESVNQRPKISCWEDPIGYPGFTMVWQKRDAFIMVQAFYANDNDNIRIEKGKGHFSYSPHMKNIKNCTIENIEDVIDKGRIKIFL